MNNYYILLITFVFYVATIVAEPYNVSHVCSDIQDGERIECSSNTNEQACISKGCCWRPISGLAIWCHYPKTYDDQHVCMIPSEEKKHCVPNMDEQSCVASGCCWHEQTNPGPWCYYPKVPYIPPYICSTVPEKEKVDCLKDFKDVNEKSCTMKGCCWHPQAGPEPWCYYAKTYDVQNVCAHITNSEKIDCQPYKEEKSCIAHGCCWRKQSTPGPWCFYPKLQKIHMQNLGNQEPNIPFPNEGSKTAQKT